MDIGEVNIITNECVFNKQQYFSHSIFHQTLNNCNQGH